MKDPVSAPLDHSKTWSTNGGEPPFIAYFRSLRFQWKTWAAAGIAGLVLGWIVVAAVAPRYETNASLEIVGLNESFLGIDEITPTAPDSRLPLRADMATRVRILRSAGLRSIAVNRLLEAPVSPPDSRWESAVLAAAEGLEIRASDDSRIVDISCRTSDPIAAASLVNALAEEFVAYERRTRLDQAQETGEWMDSQLAVLAARSQGSDARLQEHVREAGLPLGGLDAGGETQAGLRALKQELLEARSERMRLQARAELLGDLDAETLPVEETTSLRSQRANLSVLLAERAELLAVYLPEHYKVQQLEAQIAEIERGAQQEKGRILTRFRADFDAAVRREELLAEELQSQEERVRLDQEKEVAYRIADREAAANRELYESFLKQVKQAGLAVGLPAGSVRILDLATPPIEPAGPEPALGALAGLFTGLFFGGLFVIARDQLDRTFKRPGDARRALDLRELGAVPDAAFAHDGERMTPAGLPTEELPCAEKATVDSRPSWLAECVRGVRTSLFLGPDSPHVLTVTSPTPGEGKTTVAANLAASIAESGRRTLLVDADFRRPRLNEVFGVSNSQGLADLLRDEKTNPAALCSEIAAGLWLLPAGVASFGGPGLLKEECLQEILIRLRHEFEVIILDAPPALAVSDARTLARIADGTVLVVRAGVTNPADASEAKAVLEDDGARLLGVVLNSWNPKAYGPKTYEKYGAAYRQPTAA